MKTDTNTILLACDLDRTILPNGNESVSSGALLKFSSFVSRKDVIFVCISGRHMASIQEALTQYEIPLPSVVVGDVGTSMYFKKGGVFDFYPPWREKIKDD